MSNREVAYVSNLAELRAHPLLTIGPAGIVCLECGGIYQNLAAHLKGKYQVDVQTYKARWGCPRSLRLVSLPLREAMRKRGRAQANRPLVPDAALSRLRCEGMSIKAIARAVGLAPSTVRRRLRRIHGRLEPAG